MMTPYLSVFQSADGGRYIPVTLMWFTDGQATIDPRIDNLAIGPLAGAYVDNTGNSQMLVVRVPSTGQQTIIPAGSVGTLPLFMTGQQAITITNGPLGSTAFGSGQTSFIFTDQNLGLSITGVVSTGAAQNVADQNVALSQVTVPSGKALVSIDGTGGYSSFSMGTGATPTANLGVLQQTIAANAARAYFLAVNQDTANILWIVFDDGSGNQIAAQPLNTASPDNTGGGVFSETHYKGRIRLYGSANFFCISA